MKRKVCESQAGRGVVENEKKEKDSYKVTLRLKFASRVHKIESDDFYASDILSYYSLSGEACPFMSLSLR